MLRVRDWLWWIILIPENKIAHDSYIRIVGLFLATNGISIFQADAEWQGDAKAMLRAIAFNAAAVIEEILQAWLYVEADVRRDVVLDADTHGGGPLERYAELFLLAVGVYVIYKVIHIESAVYGLF